MGCQDVEGKRSALELAKQYQGQLLNNTTRAKIYNEGATIIRKTVMKGGMITGAKFAGLAASFGLVNYGLMSYRRKSDPINFLAGGTALGAVGGAVQGGLHGMMRGGVVMGGVGLAIGGLVEANKFGAALDLDSYFGSTEEPAPKE